LQEYSPDTTQKQTSDDVSEKLKNLGYIWIRTLLFKLVFMPLT
jgi:hypothetical protein